MRRPGSTARSVMASLSAELLRLFALGQLSAVDVQKLAGAAWADGWGQGSVIAKRLYRAGNMGRTAENLSRDVLLVAKSMIKNSAHPYKHHLQDGSVVDAFLPHETAATMLQLFGPEALSIGDRIDTEPIGGVIREWAGHADVQIPPNEAQGVVGFGIHYDGVQYTSTMRAGGAKSIQVASLNVVTARAERVRQIRAPLFIFRKGRFCQCGCQGFHTLQILFDIIAWSFRYLLLARMPDCRHGQSPWTAYDSATRMGPSTIVPRGGLLQVRGDCMGGFSPIFPPTKRGV